MEEVQKIAPNKKPVTLPIEIVDLKEDLLKQYIMSRAKGFYQDTPKDLQVEAVMSLVQGQNTFVRAGTGYGKSRISEMYFKLFKSKVTILVLNPLDSLGDDQVREKTLVNITAINLNKMTLNYDTIQKIKKGDFSFIYLSPEVFLNSSLFTELFFSEAFQNKLALIVVDEAHMVYLWGLVQTRQSKNLIIFERHEDVGVFRPSYGHMGARLMATNKVPLLLLSATGRPVAVESILTNLMMQPSDINMMDGELTRPEIRLIRVSMLYTLKSGDDLLRVFGPHTKTSASKTVPTIIYSGSCNGTFQVMKVVNEARGTKWQEYNPESNYIRRFHSCTGDEDKLENMKDFADGKYPIISSTMALGLGQNLKRVQCVIHMGRGDPSSIVQMIGRCGRGGTRGLALMFMEPTRVKGKNSITDFVEGKLQNDDSRMDALAVTTLCLRAALNIDNKFGYIPLDVNDKFYQREKDREVAEGFPLCDCSNCKPNEANKIMEVIQQMDINNFGIIVSSPMEMEKDNSLVTMVRPRKSKVTKGTCPFPESVASSLANALARDFAVFYFDVLGPLAEYPPGVFFGDVQVAAVVDNIDQIYKSGFVDHHILEKVIGGECFLAQLDRLGLVIANWFSGDFFQKYLSDVEAHNQHIDAECKRLRKVKEDHSALMKKEAKSRAAEKRKQMRSEAKAAQMAESLRLVEEQSARALAERNTRSIAREEARVAKEVASAAAKNQRRVALEDNKRKAEVNKAARNKRRLDKEKRDIQIKELMAGGGMCSTAMAGSSGGLGVTDDHE